ncbi:MAG: hypothetical protein IRZ08_09190 [Frankia sp.]|nr:hypothetical protein [Frankia sp.]
MAVRTSPSEASDAPAPRADAPEAPAPRADAPDSLEQARTSLEALGRLAGSVAHDVNNLLSVITNYAEFVAAAIDEAAARSAAGGQADCDGDPAAAWEAVRRDIAQIRRAGELATELNAQLLAYARQRSSQLTLVSLNDVARRAVALLDRAFGDAIEIRVQLADDLWPVLAIPIRLEQAVVNLMTNARDAMPNGGMLTLATRNVMLPGGPCPAAAAGASPGAAAGPAEAAPAGNGQGRSAAPCLSEATGSAAGRRSVLLRVTDTGTGMAPWLRARAVEPYVTTKAASGGTGLGLTVVRDVVTEAGGEVRISSQVAAGTTVSILLPAAEPAG